MSPEVGRAVKGPAVSVVMAVRDGLPFIGTAVESILDQTFTDFEFVVVDDGSNDGTSEVLNRYAQRDKRLKVRHQEWQGLVPALNLGCDLAQGALIARMDADDIALPDRLERQVRYLHDHPEVVLLGGAMVRIDSDGQTIDLVRPQTRDRELRLAMAEGNQLAHPTIVFRRAAFVAAGGYRPAFRHGEDYDLWLRLMERGGIASLANPVILYRLHPGQVSVSNIDQQCLSLLAAQVSADWRLKQGVDPLGDVELVTEAELLRLGVEDWQIAARRRRGRIDWAILLMLAGHHDAALRLCHEATEIDLADGGASREDAARFCWACAKAYARRSRYGRSLLNFLRTVCLRPSLVAAGARSWIRTWWAGRRELRKAEDRATDA